MKKVLLFVAVAATFSLAACSGQKSNENASSVDSAAQAVEEAAPVVVDTAMEVVE